MEYDYLIKNGRVFSGRKEPSSIKSIGIKEGKIVQFFYHSHPTVTAKHVIDAKGLWVMPGFIDMHTHYDVEIESMPEVSESLRHGVTTVVLGSCSIGMGAGTVEDLTDMYCRVEAIPRPYVLSILKEVKNWNTFREYAKHFETRNFGPNVSLFVGHSTLRAHVLGLANSVNPKYSPTKDELEKMRENLKEALECGYLGLSINTLSWDKLAGEHWSSPLPSTFAKWSEYRYLAKEVRKQGAIFQGVPNVTTKYNYFLFAFMSGGLFRPKMKTSVISLMDLRYNRLISYLLAIGTRTLNVLLNADFKVQALPEEFDFHADGIDIGVFEEFGAGAAALHLKSKTERNHLFSRADYRKQFKREWYNPLLPKVFHRNFSFSKIVECPDTSLIGKSFAEVALDRNQNVIDTFLDLCVEFDEKLRWYTVMANDRVKRLRKIIKNKDAMIGFSDAGAHLRNMAHYNFPLRMLKLVQDAELNNETFMSTEEAVWRLTGELAEWHGIDAGILDLDKRADITIIDPKFLNHQLEEMHECAMEKFGGLKRLVRRNDSAVPYVFVNGKMASKKGQCSTDIINGGYGQFLPRR